MLNKYDDKSKGQIVVLFAVVLVVVLALTALAVDAATMYSDKRSAQNTADSAALAGAGAAAIYFENNGVNYDNFTCANGLVVTGENAGIAGAIASAAVNDATIDADISDDNGVQVTCNVIYMGPYYDKYIDIKVAVTHTTDTAFAQLFNPNVKKETADATARVHPRTNIAYGYGIAALGTGTCTSSGGGDSGISLTGLIFASTTHGGVYSNSCIYLVGSGSITVSPSSAGITYLTNYYKPFFLGIVSPPPTQGTAILPGFNIPAPKCDQLANDYGNVSYTGNKTITMEPGRYGSVKLAGNVNVTMNPGLYCISNGMTLNGTAAELHGYGVTLVLSGGGITNNGFGTINLTAPNYEDPAGLWIKGLVLYLPPSNTNTSYLTYGVYEFGYEGTIYAPSGTLELDGGTFHFDENYDGNIQLVAKRIVIAGISGLTYNGSAGMPVYSQTTSISLQE
jgi:hypothetical protein